MWDMHDGWGWWMLFGWVWMVVLWGVIIWAVVTLINRIGGRDDRRGRSSAMDILEERFARGEIDRQQFEAMREALERSSRG